MKLVTVENKNTLIVKDFFGYLEMFEEFLISKNGEEFLTQMSAVQKNKFIAIIDVTQMALTHIELDVPNKHLMNRVILLIEDLIDSMYKDESIKIYSWLLNKIRAKNKL